MKLERYSFPTAFFLEEIGSRFASLETGTFSRADSCVLDSLCLARLVLRKLSFVEAANRSPTLLSRSLLVFQSGKQLERIRFHLSGLLVTGTHGVVPHALDNLSMGKGEKGRRLARVLPHRKQLPQVMSAYVQMCRRTPRSSSPKQLPIFFEQTLSEWKIFLVSHYLRRIGINGMSKLRTQPNTA